MADNRQRKSRQRNRLALTPNDPQEPEIEFRYHDHIEPGEYLAYCRSANIHFDQNFRRWVCSLQFDIVADDRTTLIARLTKFFNLGTADRPRNKPAEALLARVG
jgi:hypothetical protein